MNQYRDIRYDTIYRAIANNHHQHQQRTKVTADKGQNSSLQSGVVGQKSASGSAFCPLDPQKKSAVTVRILPVVQSADPHLIRSRY